MQNFLTLALTTILVISCAGYQPIVDMRGIDQAQYQQDLQDCKYYASQVQDNTARNALIGGALGAALGAVTGGNTNTVGTGAGIGAIAGGGTGKASQVGEKERVLKNCLRGRGYTLLN